MPDSQHTLEIEVLAKDFASKNLKRVGAEGEKAGKRTSKALKGAKKDADAAKGSFIELGKGGAKAASMAGTSFAALGASMSLATANMDNIGMSAAGAAGSIAAGFGSGGIVGGAIAIASAGVGALIFAFRQAGEAAKAAAEEASAALGPLSDQAKSTAEALEGMSKASAFERKIAEGKLAGSIDEVGEKTIRLNARFNEMRREAVRTFNDATAKVNDLARALANDDLDDDIAKEMTKQYNEAVTNVERLRSGITNLTQVRQDELRVITAAAEAEKQRDQAAASAAALKASTERAAAYRDQLQSLREMVGTRERLSGMDEIAKALDADRGMVHDLRLKGLNKEADILAGLVNKEEQRLRATRQRVKDEAAATKAQAAAARIRNESFSVKMLQARTEAGKLAVRHAKEVADFEGTRAERGAMLLRQRAEMVDLARRAKEEAIKEGEERAKSQAEYTAGLHEANGLLMAERDGTEKLYDIRKRMAEAAKEGGRAATDALQEQLRLQGQISQEKEKQAATKQREANFQSNLERMINGGTMDKGLARRRNERKARNRLRKYRRAGQLDEDGNYQGGGIRNANAGGAIWAGGTATGLGSPTQLSGGQGDMDRKGKQDPSTPAEVKAANQAKDKDLGLPDLGKMAEEALGSEGLGKVVTGLKDAAEVVRQKYRNVLDGLTGVFSEIEKGTKDGNEALKEGAKEAERIHDEIMEANKTRKEMTDTQKETVTTMREAVTMVGTMRDAVSAMQVEVQRLKDAASLKGGN